MSFLRGRVWRFLTSEDGPTTVEYAVMLALIVMACFATIQTLGITVNGLFEEARDNMPD
ncbi:MAG TPA: Flp family type IVb pilin [Planctomycetaceae bacterium]|nr:Flp family type IVb pilin [Planctomycetaceae bacterium]